MQSPITISGQSVPLEGIANARELGGYKMTDGRSIKRGCLIRCGCLKGATDRDVEVLKSLGIKYVFDYRTVYEQNSRPDRKIEGITYISLPCIDPEKDKMVGSEFSKHAGAPGFEDFLSDYAFTEEAKHLAASMYRNLVLSEYTQLQYGTFLNYAARNESGSLLWHCSQGKDRTGLASAFLLFSLGASRQLVIDDFDLSNYFYKDQMEYVMAKITEKGGGEPEFDVVRSLLGVNTPRFIEALDTIDTHYGSMQSYILDQLCLTKEEILILKEKFLS